MVTLKRILCQSNPLTILTTLKSVVAVRKNGRKKATAENLVSRVILGRHSSNGPISGEHLPVGSHCEIRSVGR